MIPQTILRLFRRSGTPTIAALYGAIVAQARLPVFYAGFGVPDTVEGRFDMIVLHLVLVLRRLRREAELTKLAQGLFDSFCRDMDHNLREMDVGDLSVPKEMKRLGEAFYGRQRAYEEALSGADGAAPLAAALGRNVFAGDRPRAAALLADYALRAAAGLDATDAAALGRGRLAFSDPDAILAGAEPLQETGSSP
jgi:cytochrome b pre-mRNA-processing protein 3